MPPDPDAIKTAIAYYLLLPSIGLFGVYCLWGRPRWCMAWSAAFVGFFAFLLFDGHPATSRRRADVTFVVQTSGGTPVAGVLCTVAQYAVGDGHITFTGTRESSHVSDADGRVTVVTTSDRQVTATFRAPGYRHVEVDLDRAWKPTFQEGSFGYRWAALAGSARSSRGERGRVEARFPREGNLTIPIILPGAEDEDSLVEARATAMLARGQARDR